MRERILKRVIVWSIMFLSVVLLMPGNALAGHCGGPPCVDSNDIIDGQVKTQDIKNNAVRGRHIKRNSITSRKVKDGSLTGADINPNTTLNVGSLNTTGDVGIGTMSPTEKLHIDEGIIRVDRDSDLARASSLELRRFNSDGFDGTALTIDIGMGEGLVSFVAGAELDPSGSTFNFLGTRGASRLNLHDGEIRFFTSDSTSGTAGMTATGLSYPDAKMILNSVGNVGIGTMSPEEKLHIDEGIIRVDRDSDLARASSLELRRFNSDGFDGTALTIDIGMGEGLVSFVAGAELDPSGSTFNFLGTRGASRLNLHDGEIRFFTSDSTSGTAGMTATGLSYPDAKMILNSVGNVGIGTMNPQGKLDVNGAIYQRGGLLHADYVYESDYKLESIDEHSEFMWKNKHLKAVPKARVDEDGQEIIEVGLHRRGIVEELEKAHIYIDQLYKELNELKEKFAKLETGLKGR